jgi:hypothetical protein
MNPWWLALIIPGAVLLTLGAGYCWLAWRFKDVYR